MQASAAFEIALELAVEILSTGEVPENGARLGCDRTTEFCVRYRLNSHTGAAPAVVLSQIIEPAGMPIGEKVTAGAA